MTSKRIERTDTGYIMLGGPEEGGWVERYEGCPIPGRDITFRVLRQEWTDNYNQRVIYDWREV